MHNKKMGTSDPNIDGDTAESLIHGRFNRYDFPCRAKKLGEKWPVTDIYVEFVHNKSTCYFFIQVKSTRRGISSTNKLPVGITKSDLNKLALLHAPTYLIGVDLEDENPIARSFILTVRGKYSKGITAIKADRNNKITKRNLAKLRKEVIEYWRNSSNPQKNTYKSNFDRK